MILFFVYFNYLCFFPMIEVVWPNMKTKFSFYTTLSNTKGWVSVSGPRASGKTLRVLSTCHSLLANSKVPLIVT